jgi:chloramphenicol-sensitive protein RarD
MPPLRSIITTASKSDPTLMAVICYATWGLAALVYIPMKGFGADPLEILAHRSVWALLLSAGLVWYLNQSEAVKIALFNPKTLGLLVVSAFLMASNWGVFVWAVLNAHLLEASLGYYLNPLMNMVVGALYFKDRLDKTALFAVILAILGVLLQSIAIGSLPVVAIFLAISFTLYGVIRKLVHVAALPGLFIECLVLFPFGLSLLIWVHIQGLGHFFEGPHQAFWLMITGPVTVFPLVVFAHVAKRLSLSTMGFIQFLSPTIGFMIGLFMGEPFTLLRALSFAVIWLGVIIFAYGLYQNHRREKQA